MVSQACGARKDEPWGHRKACLQLCGWGDERPSADRGGDPVGRCPADASCLAAPPGDKPASTLSCAAGIVSGSSGGRLGDVAARGAGGRRGRRRREAPSLRDVSKVTPWRWRHRS